MGQGQSKGDREEDELRESLGGGGTPAPKAHELDVDSEMVSTPAFEDALNFTPTGTEERKRISILAIEGMETDAVLTKEEEAELSRMSVTKSTPKPGKRGATKVSKLKYLYEAAIEAGFDPDPSDESRVTKECQDEAFIEELLCDSADMSAVCVYDGHGPHGRKCARRVKNFVANQLAKGGLGTSKKIKNVVKAACLNAEKDLVKTKFDTRVSGTTATIAVLTAKQICVSWVGDSRAVLGYRHSLRYYAKEMSQDHKPENKKEIARITKSGGEVRRIDFGGGLEDSPYRVFVKGTMVPGLAMSRSIGDTMASEVGAWPKPSFFCHDISQEDSFLILATDGLWEVFESHDACQWVGSYMKQNKEKDGNLAGHGEDPEFEPVSSALAKEAQKRWCIKYKKKCIVDDTAIVVVHLGDPDLTGGSKEKASRKSSLFIDHSAMKQAEDIAGLEY